jgi:serine/threonine-protein kinase
MLSTTHPASSSDSSSARSGATYGRGDVLRAGPQAFRVLRCLGIGAMGEVYEVEDQNLGVTRVVKLLLPEIARAHAGLVDRFVREAKVLAKLQHPNVVRVLQAGRLDEGTPFYVMEKVEGVSLASFIAKKAPLAPAVVIPVVVQLAAGLEAVHARGVVHRDVKPDNILIFKDRGEIRAILLDFGVMKLVSDPTPEGYCGTPLYSAPEQILGQPVDPKMDVFALGLVAFEMLTRTRAYDDVPNPLHRVTVPAPLVSDVGPRVSDALALVLTDTLALDPARRPAADALANRLLECPEATARSAPLSDVAAMTQEDLLAIPPLYEAPITVGELDQHTVPGGPPQEVLEAARRALNPTFRGQTRAGASAAYSDDIVYQTAANDGGDTFDVMAHAMKIAKEKARLRAATTRTALPGRAPEGPGNAGPGGTARMNGTARMGGPEVATGPRGTALLAPSSERAPSSGRSSKGPTSAPEPEQVASAVDAAREAHDAERLQTARRRRNLALASLLAALGVGALIAARVLVGHVGHP